MSCSAVFFFFFYSGRRIRQNCSRFKMSCFEGKPTPFLSTAKRNHIGLTLLSIVAACNINVSTALDNSSRLREPSTSLCLWSKRDVKRNFENITKLSLYRLYTESNEQQLFTTCYVPLLKSCCQNLNIYRLPCFFFHIIISLLHALFPPLWESEDTLGLELRSSLPKTVAYCCLNFLYWTQNVSLTSDP